MKINAVITKIKSYHKGTNALGVPIDEVTTRDKILYGNADIECTGIVTTCFASVDVINQAAEIGANLIISHEALFWNHGDHTDWLADNTVFRAKKHLLDTTGIVVWRDHDYIHSGIPIGNGQFSDGIFYGVMKKLGWEKNLIKSPNLPLLYEFPNIPLHDFAQQLITKFHLNGIKVIGDRNTKVNKVMIGNHIMGPGDNDKITEIEKENIDVVLAPEVIDFTVSEYIRDSSMLHGAKTILAIGHFNLEEPGMAYMIEYLPALFDHQFQCTFIQSGDAFSYFFKN